MLTTQEKNELARTIQCNQHEVYLVSVDEMDAIIRSSPKASKKSVQDAWQKIRSKLDVGANYYASSSDAAKVAKLVGDLGGIGARAYIKTYNGKPHIILKGHPGLRAILTGTKYGIQNPKVISMGLGKAGAVAATKQGGILTIVILSTYRVVDFFLTDQATLSQLVGTLATDLVKVGIATGASILAATVAGAATFAIGPILAVVVVGFGVTYLLEKVDNNLGITERVIAGIDELHTSTVHNIAGRKQQLQAAAVDTVETVIEYTFESARATAINWFRGALREYLSPLRRAL